MTEKEMNALKEIVSKWPSISEEGKREMLDILEEEKKIVSQKETKEVDKNVLIERLCMQFGIPTHIKGYRYMVTAIQIVVEDYQTIDLVTKVLYPKVAKEHNTISSRVERAIRHAIDVAWHTGDPEIHRKIFGDYAATHNGKPANSEAIAACALYIRNKLKNNLSALGGPY